MPDDGSMTTIARLLIWGGLGLAAIGGLLLLLGRFVNLGQLPGDFSWTSGNTRIYIPLTTMIILSLVLTLLVNLVLRLFR
jgi:hypothetical protein